MISPSLYCSHFIGFVILFCHNQGGFMGMIIVAQSVYKETTFRKSLINQSLLI